MAAASKKFGPGVQVLFVIADLKHDLLYRRFDGNPFARLSVGDDVFTGRKCGKLLHTGSGAFHIARSFDQAKAAVAFHLDRKSTRLNPSHRCISYAVFCLKKKTKSETL